MLPTIVKSTMMPGIFDDFFGSDFWNERFNFGVTSTKPAVNIIESEKEYRVELATPGLSKKDIKIDLNKNVLTVSCEKDGNTEESNENYLRKEFSYTSFTRSFNLPETADAEKVSAKHTDGVLYIYIPKKPEAVQKGPKQISIS